MHPMIREIRDAELNHLNFVSVGSTDTTDVPDAAMTPRRTIENSHAYRIQECGLCISPTSALTEYLFRRNRSVQWVQSHDPENVNGILTCNGKPHTRKLIPTPRQRMVLNEICD